MNKSLQKVTLILTLSFLLFPLMWAEAQTKPASTEEIAQMKATVVKVAGDVRIRNRGKIFWHDAKVNEVLGAGDQIETKANGRIEIKLDNNNVIILKPKTKLILRKLTSNLKTGDYENLLESNIGKIRAKVEKIKGNSKFEIKTPTAVACVRGTIIYLLVYPDSTMAFFEEGVGFVTNPFSGQTFDVEPGNVYQIDENGNVTGPVIPTDEQLQDIIEGWNVDSGAEGYTEPGGGGDESLGDETDDLTDDQQDSQDEAQDDKQNSQNTELTGYQGSGLLGGTETGGTTTTTETDTDGDGTPDSTDTDDDNDTLLDTQEGPSGTGTDSLKKDTDNDGITDDREPNTDNEGLIDDYDTDDDNDGVLDVNDQFPNDPNRASGTDTDGDGIDDEFDADDNDGPLGDLDGDGILNKDDTNNNDGPLADPDNDGLINSEDNDDDGDGLSDSLETRWSDVNLNTDPLDPDSDDDGVSDVEDAFPEDPTMTGLRDSIRQKERELIDFAQLRIDRAAYLEAVERAALRADINAIVDDNENRRIDGVLEQINDAQTGKVLKDRQNNRVRVEQYVLRPSSDTVEVLNVNLRTAGEHAGLSTLDWTTRFGDQNLDSLTGAQLRALPWNDYLEAPTSGDDLVGWGPKYISAPTYFPTFMSVDLRNPGGESFYEERALNSPETKWWWFGEYRQYVARDQIRVNGGELKNFTVDRSEGSGSGNPNGFAYNPAGSGNSDIIKFNFYVISDDPNIGCVAVTGKNFNNMWEALAVNMPNALSRMDIGNNNLEIRVSGAAYLKDIDLIYVPFTRLDWNDSHDWLNDEGPR